MLMMLSLPSIHLPTIIALDAPYCLPKAVSMPMLVVRMTEFVFVVHQTRIVPGYPRAMQVPTIPCISTLNRNIIGIQQYDVEIL